MDQYYNKFSERFSNIQLHQLAIAAFILIAIATTAGAMVVSNNVGSSKPTPVPEDSTSSPMRIATFIPAGVAPTNQILVRYPSTTTSAEISKYLLSTYPVEIVSEIPQLQTLVLSAKPAEVDDTIASLQQDTHLSIAEQDSVMSAFFTPNDEYFKDEYGLNNSNDADVDMPEAWDVTQGNGITVAILDTGIDRSHPDLSSKVTLTQNFTTDATVDDNHGHGTHTAGTVAAITNNTSGVAGGCPGCRLIIGKVLGTGGKGNISWISQGIVWATDNGAKVISMSLGGPKTSQVLQDAVDYAWSHNVVVVAAAGNDGTSNKNYPGAIDNAIAVAATDSNDKKASFSNYGSWVDVAAPGVKIMSTYPKGYKYLSGTSMATPLVAATAALVWDSQYGGSAANVRSRIESTADKISGTGSSWIYGRVNAALAVGGTSTPISPQPTSNPSPSQNPQPTVTQGASNPNQPNPTGTKKPTATPTRSQTQRATPSPTPTSVPETANTCTYSAKIITQESITHKGGGGTVNKVSGVAVQFTNIVNGTPKVTRKCTTDSNGVCEMSMKLTTCGSQEFTITYSKEGYGSETVKRSTNENVQLFHSFTLVPSKPKDTRSESKTTITPGR